MTHGKVKSRPSPVIRQMAPSFFWRVPSRYSNYSYVLKIPISIQMAGCLWVDAITITNKSTADVQIHKRQNPAMSLQKGVFTSDDLLQLMLNLLAQVPWGANNKILFTLGIQIRFQFHKWFSCHNSLDECRLCGIDHFSKNSNIYQFVKNFQILTNFHI